MSVKPKVLWVGANPAPPNVRRAVHDQWELTPFCPAEPLGPQLEATAVAVVCPDGPGDRFSNLLDEIQSADAVSVLLLSPEAMGQLPNSPAAMEGRIICANENASVDELAAKLSAASALRPTLSHLQHELTVARDAAAGAADTIERIDEEMHLTGKLQQEFLPRRLPEVGPVRFGALFRPAGWVSGDIYDVIRLDETHVGFHVIDAVGHGMPAALLTMFVNKALQTKRIVGSAYQIVEPDTAISELNADICQQDLSNCRFCTAVYCVIDTAKLTLTYCRAGHPEPILVRSDGRVSTLKCPGSIIGVFDDLDYQSRRIQLEPGDRVILFTDGAEDAFCGTGAPDRPALADIISPWARMPRQEFFLGLARAIDDIYVGRPPDDDITIVVMDIEG